MDIGHFTLQLMDRMDNYNKWIINKFIKYIKGSVLEIGCGIGSITQYCIDKCDVTAVDISSEYIDIVKKRFGYSKKFRAQILDIEKELDGSVKENSFDTIVCSNVLEHIRDDIYALKNMNTLLKKDGYLVLLIPAGNALFSDLDKNLGHHRRYSRKDIENKLLQSGFSIEKQFNINIIGAIGWFIAGKILKRKELNKDLLITFNILTPLFIFIDTIFRIPVGLSIINICKKTN
ncbi:MAG TPA: hypothetical protein DCP53_08425 [Elusimicrobia bacterium]|nr:MAG: hypothetical protein A2551_01750 [Elusimicrobia bacterium RIFOXYD2_FULL_34_30]HAM39399.1 hypothetical protein [Elusimicrobiota bacterium]